jgi:hypothetical protein
MPERFSWMRLDISASPSCTRRERSISARLVRFTTRSATGYAESAASVSPGWIESMIARP